MESSEEQLESSAASDEASAAEVAESASSGETGEIGYEQMVSLYDESMRHLSEGEIVTGKVIGVTSNDVVVDIGYKSEGLIPLQEFTDRDGQVTVEKGDQVEVLLERAEDVEGHVLLSKRKAERMRVWNDVESAYKAGETIKGRVVDRIKGGLTVDVGIRAFLPGSLADIKPIKHLESLRGEDLEFKVISMDRRRNNVVLSRKAILEKEFEAKKKETLAKLEEGIRMPGVVKNITDYGVFIDLGGLDGLLHITDISWGRVNHPSEHFGVGDEVEVVILKFDPETERVSLGFKQKGEDPWTLVDKKYPLGSRVRGKVVSLVDYGAFVELEEGVEGLIHVSEMSWTKKVVNPSKLLEVGEEVEAIVSELDLDQRRISLSLRQAERNPWEELSISHPVGSVVEGTVRNLTEFGAFVQITEEIDGLVHVSDMSWTKRVKHPSEVLKKGDKVQARITNIDVENQRVSLSIKEFLPNEWDSFSSEHKVGDVVTGPVVNVTDFGLFVDVHEGLEGLAHISEIDVDGRLEDDYNVGDWVSARILRVEEEDHKVGLTMRGVPQPTEDEIAELEVARASDDEDADEADEAEEAVAVDDATADDGPDDDVEDSDDDDSEEEDSDEEDSDEEDSDEDDSDDDDSDEDDSDDDDSDEDDSDEDDSDDDDSDEDEEEDDEEKEG
ncbi:MAG: 30S ribosomal protein S1 [Thermoanaerobaculia bacterium]